MFTNLARHLLPGGLLSLNAMYLAINAMSLHAPDLHTGFIQIRRAIMYQQIQPNGNAPQQLSRKEFRKLWVEAVVRMGERRKQAIFSELK